MINDFEFNRLITTYVSNFPQSIEESSQIRAFIDYTYKTEVKKYQTVLFTYWFLQLVIPYMTQLMIIPKGEASFQLLSLVFFTACVLFSLEIMQLCVNGFKDYFSDGWNYFDILSFISILILWILRMEDHHYSTILFYILGHGYHDAENDINPTHPLCSSNDQHQCHVPVHDKWIMVLNCFIISSLLVKLLLFLRAFDRT